MNQILQHLLFVFGLALLCPAFAQAQESAPMVRREAGLQLYDLDNFSLIYKWQAPSGRYRRISFLVGSASYTDTRQNPARSNISAGMGYGLEKRAPITENLHFFHGPEISLYLAYQIQEKGDNLLAAAPGLSYLLGLMLDVSDSFYLSLELSPGFDASFNYSDGKIQALSVSTGFSTSSPALSFVYRFSSPKQGKK